MEPPCLELGFDYSSCYHLGFVNFSFYQPRMDMKYNIFYEIRGVVIFYHLASRNRSKKGWSQSYERDIEGLSVTRFSRKRSGAGGQGKRSCCF